MFSNKKDNLLDSIELRCGEVDCRSPARKRTKYDNVVDIAHLSEQWSLQHNILPLDEMVDFGVGKLGNVDLNTKCDTEVSNNTKTDFDSISYTNVNINSDQMSVIAEISNCSWDNLNVQTKEKNENVHTINYFDDLSDEIVLNIFHWLPKELLNKVALVCQRFNRLSQDESLWARMDLSKRMLQPEALGRVLSRQVIILRLSQAEICDPLMSCHVRAAEPSFKARLMYLDLSMAHISKEAMVQLFSKCRRLRKLSLENVCVNDDVLKTLSYNKDLEVINLAMAEGIEETGLRYLLTNCRKLKELNLAWTYLTLNSIKVACKHFPSTLSRLNLSGCRKLLNDNFVLDLVNNCPNLRELDLSDCTGLSGEAIQHIIGLHNLNFLALSRCYFIPHNALLLLKKIQTLMYLDIHGGYIDPDSMVLVQKGLEPNVTVNKFKFSSVARPTVGSKRTSIWGLRVREFN